MAGFKKLSPEEIRKHKGVSFTGITTVFFCHDGKGKLLLGVRSKNARDEQGKWDPGGGSVKHGERIEDSLIREVIEEYGAKPQKIDFMGYFDALRTNDDGLTTHWLAMCFAVMVNPEHVSIKETEQIDKIGWFDLDNLPSPLHSQYKVFNQKLGPQLRRYMDIKS